MFQTTNQLFTLSFCAGLAKGGTFGHVSVVQTLTLNLYPYHPDILSSRDGNTSLNPQASYPVIIPLQ